MTSRTDVRGNETYIK